MVKIKILRLLCSFIVERATRPFPCKTWARRGDFRRSRLAGSGCNDDHKPDSRNAVEISRIGFVKDGKGVLLFEGMACAGWPRSQWIEMGSTKSRLAPFSAYIANRIGMHLNIGYYSYAHSKRLSFGLNATSTEIIADLGLHP